MRYHKLLIILFILFSFSTQVFSQSVNSVSTNQFEGLKFAEDQIFTHCPGTNNDFYFTTNELLEVTTKTLEQPEKLKYRYSVSGGRIVGKGANVGWDLKNARIGNYKISVSVSGKNYRRKFSKEIQIEPFPTCDPPCFCPSLAIINSKNIRAGKTAIFTAQVRGGSQTLITYKWTLSEGEIIKGQGTPKIKVKTKRMAGKTITATVEIEGDVCAPCILTDSSTVIVN